MRFTPLNVRRGSAGIPETRNLSTTAPPDSFLTLSILTVRATVSRDKLLRFAAPVLPVVLLRVPTLLLTEHLEKRTHQGDLSTDERRRTPHT